MAKSTSRSPFHRLASTSLPPLSEGELALIEQQSAHVTGPSLPRNPLSPLIERVQARVHGPEGSVLTRHVLDLLRVYGEDLRERGIGPARRALHNQVPPEHPISSGESDRDNH